MTAFAGRHSPPIESLRVRNSLLDNPKALLWTVILAGVVLHVFLGAIIGYGFGEGYYVATARVFELSYFDQPPLSLWMAWGWMKLTGTSDPFVIRLPWIAMFAVSSWAIYRLTADFFGERAGAFAALLLNVSAVFALSIGEWIQPDGPLIMFLLLATIVIARILDGRSTAPMRDWALAGLLFGLALLSKYHAVLTFAGLLIYVATVPEARRRFFVPGLAVAGGIAVVICLPIIVWNIRHDWVSFAFQGGRITDYRGLHPDWLMWSILGQAALIGIFLWPFLMFAWWRALGQGRSNRPYWFLTCLAILPVIIFTVAALWAPFGNHFHWQSPGYLFLFPILADQLAKAWTRKAAWPGRVLALAVAGHLALVAVFSAQATTAIMARILPASITDASAGLRNPLNEMVAWPQLRDALEEKGLLRRDRLFATALRWFHVGKIDREVGDIMPVTCLCSDPRNIGFIHDQSDFAGWDALVIGENASLEKARALYGAYFDTIEEIDQATVTFRGMPETTIGIFLATGYTGTYPMPWDKPR